MNKHAIREKYEFTNLRHLVEWAAKKYENKTAYSYCTDPHQGEIIKVSFTQFGEDVRALASELLAMGCSGKHCALHCNIRPLNIASLYSKIRQSPQKWFVR